MKTHLVALLIGSALLSPASAQPAKPAAAPSFGTNKELTQVSTINVLIKGGYDGLVPIGDLRKLGTFGIGTLDHLDGEMIALDGKVFQMDGAGMVHPVADETKTPFAAMTNFQPDETFPVKNIATMADLTALVDAKIPSPNFFYAIKIHGNFSHMKVRTVPRQEKPYRPLTEVTKGQSRFDFADTSGTLVGFRCPDFVQGINVAGYHLHYISYDKLHGGHVLDFNLTDGEVNIDYLNGFRLILPEDEEFMKMNLSDRGDEAIHKVEKLTGSEDVKSTYTLSSSTNTNNEPVLNMEVVLSHNNKPLKLSLKAEGTAISAADADGKSLWDIKIPDPANGHIRSLRLDDHNKIQAVQGKHTFYEIDPLTGKFSLTGSD